MSATVDQVETTLKAVKLAEVLGDDQKENCSPLTPFSLDPQTTNITPSQYLTLTPRQTP